MTATPKPVAWIRFRSEGAYEGPIADCAMDDVRRKSGAWTPLYAQSTIDAAVAAERDRWNCVFDGTAVVEELRRSEVFPIAPRSVSDVLDAIARIVRSQP